MQVRYERSDDIPAGLPLVVDESPDGLEITICLRSDLITESACVLLTRTCSSLTQGRQLVPRMRDAS